MLACLLALVILAGLAVLFAVFMVWVFHEHRAATKYRDITRVREAKPGNGAR